MDDKQYKDWVKILPLLSAQQMNDLSNRMKVLSFAQVKAFDGKADFGVRVSEAVCRVFNKLGIECPNPATLRRSSAYVNAKLRFADVEKFIEKVSAQRLVQDAVLVIAVEQLYHDILGWGIPVSSHTLLNQIHRLPASLNRAFPGYATSGLLHKLVKHEAHGIGKV